MLATPASTESFRSNGRIEHFFPARKILAGQENNKAARTFRVIDKKKFRKRETHPCPSWEGLGVGWELCFLEMTSGNRSSILAGSIAGGFGLHWSL
jgi:hypothetical protein